MLLEIEIMAGTHVLVACVSENNDRERCKNLNRSLHMKDINVATCRRGITSSKVVDHKNDQISNGNKRNNGGVLQAVEPAQE